MATLTPEAQAVFSGTTFEQIRDLSEYCVPRIELALLMSAAPAIVDGLPRGARVG
jgi:hypothetical protein